MGFNLKTLVIGCGLLLLLSGLFGFILKALLFVAIIGGVVYGLYKLGVIKRFDFWK